MNRVAFWQARSISMFRVWPLILLGLAAGSGAAQNRPVIPLADSSAVIAVDVRLVVLHGTVHDKSGAIVRGLQQGNFRVLEDGKLQAIRSFQSVEIPAAVGLVIDSSGSMQRRSPDVAAAAVALASSSNGNDEMFILKFSDRVTLGLPDTALFSASASLLERAIYKPVLPGRTALYDAIGAALAHLQRSERDRKVLVVMSDGGDNASRTPLHEILREVGQSDVVVYTVAFVDQEDGDSNAGALRQVAQASGGEHYLLDRSSDAIRVCERIARDIRTQYTITYSPSNPNFDGKRRTIRVSAAGRNGEKLLVRTRTGYIAGPSGRTVSRQDQGQR